MYFVVCIFSGMQSGWGGEPGHAPAILISINWCLLIGGDL